MATSRTLFWSFSVRLKHSCCCHWPSKSGKLSNSDIKKIEDYWRQDVLGDEIFRTNGPKKYILSMFPYPSGNLHMGHVRNYTISDSLARFYSLSGYQILHPMGWDAFGLPAENAAIERKLDPKLWTERNISTMREQLIRLGCNFQWSKELSTCDPSYYRWTQWLFLQLFSSGLVERRHSIVNWDPVDKTVLANEQIDSEGYSWRSGALAQKKTLKQWFIKTSKFASELLAGLDCLENWFDVIDIQKHWIGPCDSYVFRLPLIDRSGSQLQDRFDIYVDDPVHLCQPLFVIVKSSHVLCLIAHLKDDSLLDVSALNPLTGQLLPIVVSDDDVNYDEHSDSKLVKTESVLSSDDVLKHSQLHDWGGYITSRKLRDWVVSRQRYWGTPIPIVHCKNCGTVPVPNNELPVCLPDVSTIKFGSVDGSPLANITDWVSTNCPQCGCDAKRETDTLDTFFDSAWYFLRYLDPTNEQKIFDPNLVSNWMPVDLYIGGKEHAAVHLFFARFIMRFLHSKGIVSVAEPFAHLLPQGIVHGKTLQVEQTGKYLPEDQVSRNDSGLLIEKATGSSVMESWQKMSKSRYNGVNPQDILDEFGTDITRLMILSNVAPQTARNWDTDTHRGIRNWYSRIIWLVDNYISERGQTQNEPNPKTEEFLKENYNYFVRLVLYNMTNTRLLNVAIARLQGLTNSMRKTAKSDIGGSPEFERCLHSLIIMLNPFAPHFSAELWSALSPVPAMRAHLWQKDEPVWKQKWPTVDPDAHFDLELKIDDLGFGRIRIDRRKLNEMSLSDAFQMAMEVKKFKNELNSCNILHQKLVQIANYGARLLLQTDKIRIIDENIKEN